MSRPTICLPPIISKSLSGSADIVFFVATRTSTSSPESLTNLKLYEIQAPLAAAVKNVSKSVARALDLPIDKVALTFRDELLVPWEPLEYYDISAHCLLFHAHKQERVPPERYLRLKFNVFGPRNRSLKFTLLSAGTVLSAKLCLQEGTHIPALIQRWSIPVPGSHCRRITTGQLLDYGLKSGDTIDVRIACKLPKRHPRPPGPVRRRKPSPLKRVAFPAPEIMISGKDAFSNWLRLLTIAEPASLAPVVQSS